VRRVTRPESRKTRLSAFRQHRDGSSRIWLDAHSSRCGGVEPEREVHGVTTGTAVAPAPAARSAARAEIRTDIQGLRAIAVTSVLLYHLWPNRLTGGFTGVDVFFVISGFLITSHLLAHPPTNAHNLLSFWSRRIRRLLPASLLVLLVTLIASRIVAPDTQWGNTARQVHAAALYVVNWRLAADSVDYLAKDNTPSPVQHFWSLSVEEQFYLFWPILILVLVLAARALHFRLLPTVFGGLALVVAASLAYSVYDTDTEPARAYFVTPTRVWELGVGGLLAAALSRRALGRRRETEAVPLPVPARTLLAWLGLAAMAFTLFTYTGSTPFPGWQALLPVLGAGAVIAANAPLTRTSPGPILAIRPIQWLGDVSYSVYLWHWPLIVLVPYVSGNHIGLLDKVVIILASLVLAGLTKRFVEDRFRTPKWGRPLVKPFALAAAGMAIVVGAAALQNREVTDQQAAAQQRVAHVLAHHGTCFGAAALAAPKGTCKPTTSGPLTPDPVQAAKDKSNAYAVVSGKKDCFSYLPSFPVVTCKFGTTSAPVKNVALVGNSHAGQWLPALESVAEKNHWQITTYLASQCALSDVAQQFDTSTHSAACLAWVHKATQQVNQHHYDLVVMTNRISVGTVGSTTIASSQQPYEKGYESVLRTFQKSHTKVVTIRDTPAPGKSVPDCLAAHTTDYSQCDGTRSSWLPADPITAAVNAIGDPDISEVDLINYICAANTCPAAVGGVPVYFDGSHLTATYSTTLAPYLEPALRRALRRP
jgi:peptidoglycan/LPS O-acetylase OafA/YrhL